MKITQSMKGQILEAGFRAIDEECTVPAGSDAYGEVYRDLSIFLDILDESETFEEVQKTLDHVRQLQYCGFNAAYDQFFSLMKAQDLIKNSKLYPELVEAANK